MATTHKPKNAAQDPEEKIETALGKTEEYLYNNGKKLLWILIAVVVLAGGFLGYRYLYQPAQAEKAGAMMFVAEQNFIDEAYNTALSGDGNNPGFLDVIDRYGSTPQGNLAAHYAGVCYLHLGELDEAMRYLTKYKKTSGAPNAIINAQNIGLQGDVLVQQKQYERALGKYEEAVKTSDNSLTAPMYLKKAGLVYMELGRGADAVKAFQRIADEFPSSLEARDIDKFLGAAGQL